MPTPIFSPGRPLRAGLVAAALPALALLLAACGGGGSPAKSAAGTTKPTTTAVATGSKTAGTTAGSTNAANPGSGQPGTATAFTPAASGQIASISGSTLEVQNTESGQTTVDVSATTRITATVTEALSDVKAGACVTASGTKTSSGALKATTVSILASVNGKCANGFSAVTRPTGSGAGGFSRGSGSFPRRGTGSFPSGSRPAVSIPANEATAGGKVTSVSASAITVQGFMFSFGGARPTGTGQTSSAEPSTSVATKAVEIAVSASTKYLKTGVGTAASLKVGECATAFGSTNDIGAVTATRLTVTPATSSGCSAAGGGFGGFPGGGGFFFRGTGGAPGAGGEVPTT